jgi:hypothetical protein
MERQNVIVIIALFFVSLAAYAANTLKLGLAETAGWLTFWIRCLRAIGAMIPPMAKQTTVTITDDIDGSTNAKEVSFSLNGRSWVIDLNAKNRAALEKALKPYIAKATEQRGGGRRGKTVRRSSRSKSRDLAAVREWARTNGHQVSDRGRISSDIQQAYDAAH